MPNTSWIWASAGCIDAWMNVFDLMPWGSSNSAGEVKPNPGSTIAATPAAVAYTASKPASPASRRRGSSVSVRFPAYSSSTVSAR